MNKIVHSTMKDKVGTARFLTLLLLSASLSFGLLGCGNATIEEAEIVFPSPQPTTSEAVAREQEIVVAAVSTETAATTPSPLPTNTQTPVNTPTLIPTTQRIEPTVASPIFIPIDKYANPLPTPIASPPIGAGDLNQVTLLEGQTYGFLSPDEVWSAVQFVWMNDDGLHDSMIRIMTATGEDRLVANEAKSSPGHAQLVQLIGWSADSRYLFYTIESYPGGCVDLKTQENLFMYDVTTNERYEAVTGIFREIKLSPDNNTLASLDIWKEDEKFSLNLIDVETFTMETFPLGDAYQAGSATNQLFWSAENDLMLMLYTNWCSLLDGEVDFYLLEDEANTLQWVTGWQNENMDTISEPNVINFADGLFSFTAKAVPNGECDYQITVNDGAFSSNLCPETLLQVKQNP